MCDLAGKIFVYLFKKSIENQNKTIGVREPEGLGLRDIYKLYKPGRTHARIGQLNDISAVIHAVPGILTGQIQDQDLELHNTAFLT